MFDRRIAWIALGGLAVAGPIAAEGCSGGDNVTEEPNAICGNGIKETGEACDDGNTNDNDSCRSDCVSSTCGDGTVQAESGEECDDGDSVDDNACSNSCTANSEYCGNGTVDDGEDCDDGNTVTDDECTNACRDPRCGDGIVQAGEDCDDGDNELNDDCPPDCMDGGGGGGGNDCMGQAIYAGMVTNSTTPTTPGSGVLAVWSYAGELGVQAGDEMCAAIGADHVCSWEEVVAAETAGELSTGANAVPDGQEFWVHRINASVPRLSDGGATMSPPGYGARCNDWTYPTGHIADGEFGYYHRTTAPGSAAMTMQVGNIYMYVDDDAEYEPNLDGANPNPVGGDHACDAGVNNANGSGTPGCSGTCGGATAKAILCCFPSCVE